jgi:hypothetical protein
MDADACVLNQQTQRYFTMFPELGNLKVRRATVIQLENFEVHR